MQPTPQKLKGAKGGHPNHAHALFYCTATSDAAGSLVPDEVDVVLSAQCLDQLLVVGLVAVLSKDAQLGLTLGRERQQGVQGNRAACRHTANVSCPSPNC